MTTKYLLLWCHGKCSASTEHAQKSNSLSMLSAGYWAYPAVPMSMLSSRLNGHMTLSHWRKGRTIGSLGLYTINKTEFVHLLTLKAQRVPRCLEKRMNYIQNHYNYQANWMKNYGMNTYFHMLGRFGAGLCKFCTSIWQLVTELKEACSSYFQLVFFSLKELFFCIRCTPILVVIYWSSFSLSVYIDLKVEWSQNKPWSWDIWFQWVN